MLSSPRMRRRLAWLGALMVVAGGIAGLVLAFPGAKPPAAEKMSTVPAQLERTPKHHVFAPRAPAVLKTASEFVATAVRGKHLAASWKLIAPKMKVGYTEHSWVHGPNLPFPLYPASVRRTRWHLSWSYPTEVGLRVYLFPRLHSRLHQLAFDVVEREYGHGKNARWLISSFTPSPGGGGATGGSSSSSPGSGLYTRPPIRHAGAVWLLLPLGIFLGLLLGLGGFFGIRSWRNAATYRSYFNSRQSSS